MAGCLLVPAVGAAVISWDSGAGTANWGDSANWAPNTGTAGLFGSDLVLIRLSRNGSRPTNQNIAGLAINSLTLAGSRNVVVSSGQAFTLGAGGLTQLTTVTSSIGIGVNLGASQAWTNNSASAFTMAGALDLRGYQLTVTGNGAMTISGNVAGTGGNALVKYGTGTLTLSGSNTFIGSTRVAAGMLTLGGSYALQNSTLDLATLDSGTVNFGTLTAATFGGLAGSRNLSSAVALTVGGNHENTLYSGTLSGAGSLIKSGTGLLTLAGNNSYTGSTVIAAGVLQLGNGGIAGSLGTNTGVISNHGMLVFNRSNTLLLANVISGTGGLTQAGTGTVTLVGNNNYTGSTIISAGTLQVGAGNGEGSLGSGNVLDNGMLTINRGLPVTVANAISGTGSLTKTGTGLLTLSGVNSYTGSTIVSGGMLRFASAAAMPSGAGKGSLKLGGGTVLDLNGLNLAVNGFADGSTGAIRNDLQGTLAGDGTMLNETFSTLTVGGGNTSSTFSGALLNGGFNSNGYSVSLGVANLVKTGTGTLILAGANNYTGSTVISGGTLQVGAGAGAGTLGNVAPVINNGALVVNRATNYVLASSVSGTGSLVKRGTGTLTLANANSFSGGLTVEAGKVVSDLAGSLGTGTVTLQGQTVLSLGGNTTLQGFGGNGAGWQFNSNTTNTANFNVKSDVATMVYQTSSQASSVFNTTKVSVTSGYVASYVYLSRGGNSDRADGVAFILQNDPRGISALGGCGSGDGYSQINGGSPILKSDIFVLDTHAVSQTGHTTNGVELSDGGGYHTGQTLTGGTDTFVTTTSAGAGYTGLSVREAQPIYAKLVYNPTTSTVLETLTNLTTGQNFIHTYTGINLITTVSGNSAYLGFSGATGSLVAWQTISSFRYSTGTDYDTVSYTNTFRVADGATPVLESAVRNLTVAKFDLGNNASLTTTAAATFGPFSATNSAYWVTANATALSGSNTFSVGNNGAGLGTLSLDNVSGVGGALLKGGAGTMILPTANSFSGDTRILSGDLLLNHSLALQNSMVDLAAGDAGTLGFKTVTAATLGGLTGARDQILANSTGVAVALTVGNNSQSTLYSGALSGPGSLIKTGTGTLTLTGKSRHTGGTVLDGGTLNFERDAIGSAPITFRGGVLQWADGNNQDVSGQFVPVAAGQTALLDTNGNRVVLNTAVTGAGGVTKLGAGTLVLTDSSSYTGATLVASGTLRVIGSGNLNSSSGITVNNGAVLAYNASVLMTAPITIVDGTITGTGRVNNLSLVIGSQATMSPGNSPGTQDYADLTWASNGRYLWEVDTVKAVGGEQDAGLKGIDPGFDFAGITGTLTITATEANPFVIDITGLDHATHQAGAVTNWDGSTDRTFTIASAAGGIVGFDARKFLLKIDSFDVNNVMLDGSMWTIEQRGANDVILTYQTVPEPAALALLLLGSLPLLRRRR